MSWNPWVTISQLRAENSTLKQETKRLGKDLDHEKMFSRVFHDANHKLIADIHAAQCELAQVKAQVATMHRRDPVTGRLLPRGK